MWMAYLGQVQDVLARLAVTAGGGAELRPDAAFERWVGLALGLGAGGSMHLIGNGASASMASHFAADITKNCRIRANVFTDCALVTALANDHGYENAYAIALTRYARKGDLLVAISSSGESKNILTACRQAMNMGVDVVTLSGKNPGNRLRGVGNLNFHVPAKTFSLAESSHAVILHHWTDRLEAASALRGWGA